MYDSWYAPLDSTAAVDFLAELAGTGAVLELGIGTGRIALPLGERGIDIHGIDASEAMLAQMRAKPGGDRIPVTVGDFADVGTDGRFAVVFVAFNTFFALLTQEAQVRCFQNVAAHLERDGVFVIEAFVPDLSRFDRGQRVACSKMTDGLVQLETSRHDPVEQRVDSYHVVLTQEGTRLYPVNIRYAWPSELDLMARLANLQLQARFGSWRNEPFAASSGNHVSVYRRMTDTT